MIVVALVVEMFRIERKIGKIEKNLFMLGQFLEWWRQTYDTTRKNISGQNEDDN